MAKQTINNGETGLVTRTKLNDNFTELYNKDASQDTLIAQNAADITALEGPQDNLKFTPQVTPPIYTEGQVYYDANRDTFVAQGPFTDAFVEVGHTMHTHVINNSGALIEKGSACRHDGVSGGIVQIQKAQANSFTNAEIFGVAQHDIPDGSQGALTTFGEIINVDTSGVPTGVPLYLSDTVPGTYTTTQPDIISQVGGAITQDAVTGRLFVSIVSNKNVPTVFSGVKGLVTPSVPLTTSPLDITNYSTKKEIVMLADLTTGELTVSNNGLYRASVTADITFPSATVTRTIYVELYDATNLAVLFTYAKNIPRDATEDSFSLNFPFEAVADNKYKLRVRASTAITVNVVDVTFDIQSVNIK